MILAFVPQDMFNEHSKRYEEVVSSGFVEIIKINKEKNLKRTFSWFITKKLLQGKRLFFHVLRENPTSVISWRRLPIVGSRIRYVLEYEGDMPSEYLYQNAYIEGLRPPETPPPELCRPYQNMLDVQTVHANKADGLILMSQEQIDLWETRLGRSIKACWLPTLADTSRIFFSQDKRFVIRERLGVSGRLVAVYAGNVICKWQRLEAMCEFIARFKESLPSIWFLALVRFDDLDMAWEAIARHGLDERSTVLHVGPDEMADYLSAADLALFLRHDHLMNRVVTSGKLGEYLATGLPVITTGANAEVLNQFIRETGAGVFILDSLAVDPQFIEQFKALAAHSGDPEWRGWLAGKMAERFGGANDPMNAYPAFVRDICATDTI